MLAGSNLLRLGLWAVGAVGKGPGLRQERITAGGAVLGHLLPPLHLQLASDPTASWALGLGTSIPLK